MRVGFEAALVKQGYTSQDAVKEWIGRYMRTGEGQHALLDFETTGNVSPALEAYTAEHTPAPPPAHKVPFACPRCHSVEPHEVVAMVGQYRRTCCRCAVTCIMPGIEEDWKPFYKP